MNAAGDLLKVKTYAFAAVLTFITSLTVGNVPYLFFGYGASAMGMLAAGLMLDPLAGTAVYFIANAAALGLVAYTQSAFTLLVVGAMIVRPIQVFVLTKTRQRLGPAGASLSVVLLGTALATILGLLFYGGQASGTPLTFFDAFWVLPAYLIAKGAAGARPGGVLLAGAVLISAMGIFMSASSFFMPIGLAASAVVLAAAAWAGVSKMSSKRVAAVLFIAALILVPASLAANPIALSRDSHNAFYPLYPDSLSRSQWAQSNSSSSCAQSNLAGAGTQQNGVWGPQRLRVIDTCVTVSGTVEGIAPQYGPSNDNDFGIDIKLDPQYTSLLSVGNIVVGGSLMHAEVVPSDQPQLASQLRAMQPGDRITITGALVLDTDHGYGAEIHPVWAIQLGP